jgi:hypothetical protein
MADQICQLVRLLAMARCVKSLSMQTGLNNFQTAACYAYNLAKTVPKEGTPPAQRFKLSYFSIF